jgi:hypothetical protein
MLELLVRCGTAIRGAFRMNMEEVERPQQEIPRDRDVILYCFCPRQVSSARIAWERRAQAFRVSDQWWEELMRDESAIIRQDRMRGISASKMPRCARQETGAMDFYLHFNCRRKY